jgi:hypothetical protein
VPRSVAPEIELERLDELEWDEHDDVAAGGHGGRRRWFFAAAAMAAVGAIALMSSGDERPLATVPPSSSIAPSTTSAPERMSETPMTVALLPIDDGDRWLGVSDRGFSFDIDAPDGEIVDALVLPRSIIGLTSTGSVRWWSQRTDGQGVEIGTGEQIFLTTDPATVWVQDTEGGSRVLRRVTTRNGDDIGIAPQIERLADGTRVIGSMGPRLVVVDGDGVIFATDSDPARPPFTQTTLSVDGVLIGALGDWAAVQSGTRIELHDVASQTSHTIIAGDSDALATFSPDGQWVALTWTSGRSALVDLSTIEMRAPTVLQDARSIAWLGPELVVDGADGVLRRYDPVSDDVSDVTFGSPTA